MLGSVLTSSNEDVVTCVGATEVIVPKRVYAVRTARHVANPDIRDMLPIAEDDRIIATEAPGKTQGKPPADKVIRAGEIRMVLGRELDLVRFANHD